MKKYLKDYIHSNFKNIFTIFSFIIIGLVIGILLFNISNESDKIQIIESVRKVLDISKSENFEGINIIINSIKSNIFIIAIIYFSALTLIPKILINLISTIKGISIGLYIPVLFNVFGINNGILVLLILIIIPNLVYMSSYIYLCNNALMFHNTIAEEKIKISLFCFEIAKLFITFALMLVSVILEQISIIIILTHIL